MSYSAEVKIIRGAQHEIESDIEEYLATLTSGTVHWVNVTRYGADQMLCVIVHDA
jgi:hypothetical protein